MRPLPHDASVAIREEHPVLLRDGDVAQVGRNPVAGLPRRRQREAGELTEVLVEDNDIRAPRLYEPPDAGKPPREGPRRQRDCRYPFGAHVPSRTRRDPPVISPAERSARRARFFSAPRLFAGWTGLEPAECPRNALIRALLHRPTARTVATRHGSRRPRAHSCTRSKPRSRVSPALSHQRPAKHSSSWRVNALRFGRNFVSSSKLQEPTSCPFIAGRPSGGRRAPPF